MLTSNNNKSNALNQYTAVGSFNPTYDADGNQINAQALPLGSSSLASCVYSWDGENRLISTTVGSNITTYQYDSQSRRIAKTSGGTTTVYVYDGWNMIAQYVAGSLTKSYTWGMDLSGSMQGAGGVGGLLAVKVGSATFYPTFDGNGNVSEYLDSAGAVAAHYEYDAFGKQTVSVGVQASTFEFRFSTKLLDSETGLYYYGYRYYEPNTGRWVSRDPIEEQGGANLYASIANHGINSIDFLGLRRPDNEPQVSFENDIMEAIAIIAAVVVGVTGDTLATVMIVNYYYQDRDPYILQYSSAKKLQFEPELQLAVFPKAMASAYRVMRNGGSEVVEEEGVGAYVSGIYGNNALGNFSIYIKGEVSCAIRSNGSTGYDFKGAVQFRDRFDFSMESWDYNNLLGKAKLLVGALFLDGEPFAVRSEWIEATADENYPLIQW